MLLFVFSVGARRRVTIVLLVVDFEVGTVSNWTEHSMVAVSRSDESICPREPVQASL